MKDGQLLDTQARPTIRPQVYPVPRRPLTAWAWRTAAALAVLSVIAAAVLTANGQRALSDLFITIGFMMALLTAPLWLFAARRPSH